MPIVKYIKDDILNTDYKIIAHGVNCQNKMGSGVAKVLYTKYPKIKKIYHEFCKGKQPHELLGTILATSQNPLKRVPIDPIVINCFTQLNFGYDGKKYVSYAAVLECFNEIDKKFTNCKIAIPKIGAGLAGGDWEIIETIINLATPSLRIYVYEL
jgi:O-acetyl-ADP-ribose deacetylase (regulator of RNase III)